MDSEFLCFDDSVLDRLLGPMPEISLESTPSQVEHGESSLGEHW